MKKTRIIAALALLAMTAFTSCRKDYVCTCNTVVGAGSIDVKHDIDNTNYADAREACRNYEDEANKTLPGGTVCRL